jgi:hypothetical protein
MKPLTKRSAWKASAARARTIGRQPLRALPNLYLFCGDDFKVE